MKKWHCFLVGSILTISSSFICAPKKISIYISEYDFTFTPQKKRCNDTLTREIEDGKELKVPDILLSGNHAQIAKWRNRNKKSN